MSICVISPGAAPLPPAAGTSVELYIWQVARELSRRRPVTVYAKGWRSEQCQREAVTVRTFAVSGEPEYLRRLLRALKRQQPQLVQVENRVAFVPAVKKAVPQAKVILNLHSNVLIQRLPRRVVRRALASLDALVVCSEFLKRDLLARYPQLRRTPVYVVYPGVSSRQFPSRFESVGQQLRQAARARFQLPAGNRVILSVSRFIPRKGIGQLIDAFRVVYRRFPRAELWIVGGRPRGKSRFHQIIRRKAEGLPVRFFGFVRNGRLPAFYAAADVFVCASQLPEATGLVTMEAGSSGVPMVISGKWGIPEVAPASRKVRGYRRPREFATEILDLLLHPAAAEGLGRQAARRMAADFSWGKTAAGLDRIYRELET